MLISCRSAGCLVTRKSVCGFALVGGITSSQIVVSRKSVSTRVVAGNSFAPRVQSVGFDGRYHGHNGCPKRLVQDDGILKCLQCGGGMDQKLNVEL
jgi:hypothetical protein